MAYDLPAIPNDKVIFYRNLLYRDVVGLFEWEGLPDEIPTDYLEQVLIKSGMAMFFYEPDTFGYMALSCGVRGFNVYQQPVLAFATAPNTEGHQVRYERNIMYSYTPNLDPATGCVYIKNDYNAQPLTQIVEFYAYRMALVQQAFDTNALWQNCPVVFSVADDKTRLSIEKLFADITTGKPWVVVNELLVTEENAKPGLAEVPFLLDKLLDALNELRFKFHEAVGITTPGVDKKERLLTGEIESTEQVTQTVLDVMLSQRRRACKEITNLFPELNPTVRVRGEEQVREEEEADGTSDDGVEDTTRNAEL